jgi:hypothetical protein
MQTILWRSRMSGPDGPMLRQGAKRLATRPAGKPAVVALAKPSASNSRPLKRLEEKEFGAKHRKRKRVGPVGPPRPEVSPACIRQDTGGTLNREDKQSPASRSLLFADLVVMAGRPHPFPSRTRP